MKKMAMAMVIAMAIGAMFLPVVWAEEEVEILVEQTFVISGFGPNQHAIKGIPQEKLNALVREIREKLDNFPGAKILIFLRGSATKIGPVLVNDDLSEKRANSAKKFLEAKQLPLAESVKDYYSGDDDDAMQVSGMYKIIRFKSSLAQVVEAKQKKGLVSENKFVFYIGGIVLMVILGVGAFRVRRKIQNQEILKHAPKQVLKSIELGQVATLTPQKEFWYEFQAGEETWEVLMKIENKGDGQMIYYTPFEHLTGGKKIYETIPRELKRTLANCVLQEKFTEQRAKLIEVGLLRPKSGN